jgi:hypothetical protein
MGEADKRVSWWLAALVLGGCGPTDQEIGVSVITSFVIIVPIAAALNYGLYRLWRHTRTDLHAPTLREAALAGAVTLAAAVAINALVLPADSELAVISVWIVGSTHLTIYIALLGGALVGARRWAFRVLYWAPAALLGLLVLPMAVDENLSSESTAAIMGVLIYTGAFGVTAGLMLTTLLAVSIRVFFRDRPRPHAPPPPLTF